MPRVSVPRAAVVNCAKRVVSKKRALVFDTETTGLILHPSAKKELHPRIIEFGCVLVDSSGKELEHFDELIYPEQQIDDDITRITGLTNADLKGKPLFSHWSKHIRKIFMKADAVIAHNLPFDKGMTDHEYSLLDELLNWPRYQICTVQENVPVYGRRIKLKTLYEDVTGFKLEQKHRAIDDCRALAEIVVAENYFAAFA